MVNWVSILIQLEVGWEAVTLLMGPLGFVSFNPYSVGSRLGSEMMEECY